MALPIPVTSADMPFIHGCLREAYEQDRAMHGYPVCSIVNRVNDAVDPISGTYSEHEVVLFADIECSVHLVSEEQIQASGGTLTPEDEILRTFSLTAMLDNRNLILYNGRYWKIIRKNYLSFNSRTDLIIRVLSETP